MSFLDLPPEIRNIIYKWLFPKGPAAAQLLVKRNDGYLQMSDRFTILETCRQIYQEVSSLLRGQQRFLVMPSTSLFTLMDAGQYTVEGMILDYLMPDGYIDFHYDLDHFTVSSERAYLLHVSQGLRSRVAHPATIRMTAALFVTGGFQRLKQWTQSGRNSIPNFHGDRFAHLTQIELHIPRISCNDNRNFTMDTMEFISAARDSDPTTEVRTVVYDEQEITSGDDQELQSIRAGLLLFIHALIKKYPEGMCTKMWLQRDLRVAIADMRYRDGSIERVANKSATCPWHRIVEYILAADLVRYYRNMEGLQPHERALTSMAKTLADFLYEDLY